MNYKSILPEIFQNNDAETFISNYGDYLQANTVNSTFFEYNPDPTFVDSHILLNEQNIDIENKYRVIPYSTKLNYCYNNTLEKRSKGTVQNIKYVYKTNFGKSIEIVRPNSGMYQEYIGSAIELVNLDSSIPDPTEFENLSGKNILQDGIIIGKIKTVYYDEELLEDLIWIDVLTSSVQENDTVSVGASNKLYKISQIKNVNYYNWSGIKNRYVDENGRYVSNNENRGYNNLLLYNFYKGYNFLRFSFGKKSYLKSTILSESMTLGSVAKKSLSEITSHIDYTYQMCGIDNMLLSGFVSPFEITSKYLNLTILDFSKQIKQIFLNYGSSLTGFKASNLQLTDSVLVKQDFSLLSIIGRLDGYMLVDGKVFLDSGYMNDVSSIQNYRISESNINILNYSNVSAGFTGNSNKTYAYNNEKLFVINELQNLNIFGHYSTDLSTWHNLTYTSAKTIVDSIQYDDKILFLFDGTSTTIGTIYDITSNSFTDIGVADSGAPNKVSKDGSTIFITNSAGGTDFIGWLSLDDGSSWTKVQTNISLVDNLTCSPNGLKVFQNVIYVTLSNTTKYFGLISLNYGKHWKLVTYSAGVAISAAQLNNPQINESNIFIYSDESDVIGYYSLDFGISWNKQSNYSGIIKGKIVNENNKTVIINSTASYNCAIYSINNGLTWKPIVQEKLNIYTSSFFVNDDIWMYSPNGDILSNQNKYDDFIVRYNVGSISNPILNTFKNKMVLVSNAPVLDGYSYKILNIEYSRNGITDNISKVNYLTLNAINFANKDEILNLKANVLFTSLDIAPMNVLYENGTLIPSKFYQATGLEFGTDKITAKSKVNYLQTNPTELNGQIYHIAPSFKFKPFKIYDITFAGSVINISTNGVELNDGDTVYINNNGKLKELTLHKVVKTTISTKILKLSVNIEGYGGYTAVNLIITGNSLSGLTVPLDRINSDISNMSYVNNTALALENNAIIESREFVLCSDYYAIKPAVTLTPTLFEIDPTSSIGSLKLAFNQNGMLSVGDKLIVEQNNILSSITIIEMNAKFSADFNLWEYVDINNGGTSPIYPVGSILDVLSFVGTPTAKNVISSSYNSTSNLDSFDFEFKINPIKSWKIKSTSTASAVSFISNDEVEFYPGDTLLFEQNGIATPIKVNNVVNSLYGTQMTSTEVIHASTGGRGITYRNANNELCMYIPAAYNNISALYKLNESNDTFEKISNVSVSVGGGYGEAMVIDGVTYFILHNGALSILKLNETGDDVSLVQQMNTLPGVNYMTYDVKCLRIKQTSSEHLIFASVKMSNPFANQEILAFKYNPATRVFDLISQIATNFGSNHTYLASFDICIYLNEIYLIGLVAGARSWSQNYSIITMYKYSSNALTLITSINPRQGPEFDNIGAATGKITIANKDYVIITVDAHNYFDIYTTNDGLTLTGLPIAAPLPKVMYPGVAVCSIKPFMHKGNLHVCLLSKKANYWSNWDDNYTDLWIYQVNSDLSLTYLFRYDYPYIANNFDVIDYNGDVAIAIGSNTVQATFITNLFNTNYSHLITDTAFASVPTQVILANQRYYYSTSELAPYKWTLLTDINYSYNKPTNVVTTHGSFTFDGTSNVSVLKLKADRINENDILTQIKAVIRNVPAVNNNNYEKIYSSYYLGNSTTIPNGFYLGGEDGHVYYSADTSSWTTLSSRVPNIVTALISSPTMIIAFDALGNFSNSTDGSTWTLANSKISNFRTNDCIYANGKYILVTEGGEVYTSQSGTSWSKSLIKSDYPLNSLCYNAKDKLYVFAGNNGVILTSTDLINSTVRNGTFLNYDITSITTNNSEYVIVGDHGLVNTSIDGITWLDASSGYGDNLLTDVLYANGLFVGVGESRSIITSENGKDWTLHRNSWVNCGYIESIIYGRGLFVASGYRGGAIKCGTLDTYRTVYTITNPSLSVAVPTWVAKGGQTLYSSVGTSDTPNFIASANLSYSRTGTSNLNTSNVPITTILSITGSITTSPLYAINEVSLPASTNMTITGNDAVASANNATVQTFDYIESGFTVEKITPALKFIVGNVFNIDPSSTIGNLKIIAPLGVLATGDKLLIEQNGDITETSPISVVSVDDSLTLIDSTSHGSEPGSIVRYMIGADIYVSCINQGLESFSTFKWNGSTFVSIGSAVATEISPSALVSFAIGADTYISVVNNNNANNNGGTLSTYKWNGTSFDSIGSAIPIARWINGITAYRIGSDNYISIIGNYDHALFTYKWNGSAFVSFGAGISTGFTPNGIVSYTIGTDTYISVVTSTRFSTFKWNGSTFVSIGTGIDIAGTPTKIVSYTIGTDKYISIVTQDASTMLTFKWNGSAFVSIGADVGTGSYPYAIISYSIGTDTYISVSSVINADLFTYKWNGSAFIEITSFRQSISTAMSLSSFLANGKTYLVAGSVGLQSISTYVFDDAYDIITAPSLSVAVPTWVAKGGQTLQYSVSTTSTPNFLTATPSSITRVGNLVTKTYPTLAGISGTHVQLKAIAFNKFDSVNLLGALLESTITPNALTINGQLVSNVFGNHFRFKCENINANEIVSSLSLSVMSDVSIPFDSTTITYVNNAILANNILHSYNNGECSTYTHSATGKISEIACSVKIRPLKIPSLLLESDLPNITFVSSVDNLFPIGSTVIYDNNGTGTTTTILSMTKTVKFFSGLTGAVNRYGNFVRSDAYSNNFIIGTDAYFTFNASLGANTGFISTYKIDKNENLTLVNELNYSSYNNVTSTDTLVIGNDIYLIVRVPVVLGSVYTQYGWEVLKFNKTNESWEPFKNLTYLPLDWYFIQTKVNIVQCKPIVTSAGYYILFYYQTYNRTLEEVSSGLDINGYVYKWNGTTFVQLKRLVTPLEEPNSWNHYNYNGTVLHYRVSGTSIAYAIWDIENEMFGTLYTLSLARAITHVSPFINNGHLYFGISTSGNGSSTYDDFETWKYNDTSNQFSYLNTIQQNPTSMIDRTTNVVMEYEIPYTINKYVASGNTYAVTRKFDSSTESFNMIEYFLYVNAASINLNNIFPFNNSNGKLYIWEGSIGMTGPASIRVITDINRTYHYNTVLENYADTHASIPEYVYIDNKRLYSSVTLDADPLSYSECIFDSKTIENDIITYNAKAQQANGNKIKLKLTSLIDGEECSAFKFNFTTTEQSSSSTIDYNYSSVDIDNSFTDTTNTGSTDGTSNTNTWALGAYPVMKYALTDTDTNSPVFLDFTNPVYTRNANDEIEVKYDNAQLNLSALGEIQSIEPVLQSPAYVESSTGFLDTEIKTVYCGNSETLDLIKDEFKNELLIPKSYVINLTDHNRTLYDLIYNSDINYSIAYSDLKLSFILNTDVSINRRIPIVLRPDNSGTLIKLYFDLNVSRINGINRLVINQELIEEIENTTDSTFSYNLSIWNLLKYGTGLPLIDKGTVQKYLKTISKYSNILITDIQKDIFFELIRNNLVAGINYNFVYKTENSYTGIGTETFSDAITIIG